MATMLLALIALQDPIADLDHDDPSAREAAMRELRELRDCAESNLRSRLAAARIRSLLGRIELDRRIAAFPGGEEVDGLRAAVSIGGAPDDPRRTIRLEILNAGPVAREILAVKAWSKSLPNVWSRSGSAEDEIEIKGGPPGPLDRFGVSYGCGGSWKPELVPLRPGEIRAYEVVLDSDLLSPGSYELTARYFALGRLRKGTPELHSNRVSFVVGSSGARPDEDDPTVR